MKKTSKRDEHAELVRAVVQGRESVRTAAARLGVSRSTAYLWLQQQRVQGDGLASRDPDVTSTALLESIPKTGGGHWA